ncbi:hypothetical protein SynRS9902_01293 [Synechococcus sp. RS9902]|nr:hypothetical protein SynRS9902_01293 [Synechococcus sp. RS9902]
MQRIMEEACQCSLKWKLRPYFWKSKFNKDCMKAGILKEEK